MIPIHLDLTDTQSIRDAVDTVQDAAGAIDVLVNCAGYGEFGSIEEADLGAARAQLEVNVLSAMGLVQAVLPAMRERGHGRIVNVSSLAGEFAAPLGGWYHASKFALEALSDSLRGEVAGFGIDVTLVQPSYVATDWHTTALDRLEATSGKAPTLRWPRRCGATSPAPHSVGRRPAWGLSRRSWRRPR